MRGESYTIGKLSKLSGCAIQTIRYYEQIDLLPKPERSPRGHRLYNEALFIQLKFILRVRQLGFNLEETGELLELVDGGKYTCHEIREKTLTHVDSISHKIKDLKKMEADLLNMAENCNDDSGMECSILDALFQKN